MGFEIRGWVGVGVRGAGAGGSGFGVSGLVVGGVEFRSVVVVGWVCGGFCVWLRAFFYGFAQGVDGRWRPWLGWGGWRLGRWLSLDQELQATGFRAQPRGAMPLAALRGRLRGGRPRSEGWGGHRSRASLLVVPVRIPRRVVVAVGITTPVRRSKVHAAAVGAVRWRSCRMDLTPSARRGLRFAPTRRGIRTYLLRGVGHRSGIAAPTAAAAGGIANRGRGEGSHLLIHSAYRR